MDLESSESSSHSPSSTNYLIKCSDCGCTCSHVMNRSSSGSYLRSVKRKLDEYEDERKFIIPGLNLPYVARVEIENEVSALREMVTNQQETIQNLYIELEEERNASSSAANEAMSMILRLQSEKAEIQMEARQFKRFTEERVVHDQQELSALEELLYKREQAIQSLTCEIQAYKHRMMSYGLSEAEADGEGNNNNNNSRLMSSNNSQDGQFDFPSYDYPPLKCNINNETHVYSDINTHETYDIEKYAFGETPRSRDHLKDLEFRINQLERTPRNIHIPPESPEKVIIGQSPKLKHLRKVSTDSSGTYLKTEYTEYKGKMDNTSEIEDDMSDRVYTIDSVNHGVPMADGYISTPIKKPLMSHHNNNNSEIIDPEITKLYMRLQTLEADKESMRQALINMRTDKAQLILLKEIAQNLYKDMSPSRAPVTKRSISFTSIFKWVISFILWKKKARKCRYMFGLSPHNAGLLMLLDKGPRVNQWKCLSSTQV